MVRIWLIAISASVVLASGFAQPATADDTTFAPAASSAGSGAPVGEARSPALRLAEAFDPYKGLSHRTGSSWGGSSGSKPVPPRTGPNTYVPPVNTPGQLRIKIVLASYGGIDVARPDNPAKYGPKLGNCGAPNGQA